MDWSSLFRHDITLPARRTPTPGPRVIMATILQYVYAWLEQDAA